MAKLLLYILIAIIYDAVSRIISVTNIFNCEILIHITQTT